MQPVRFLLTLTLVLQTSLPAQRFDPGRIPKIGILRGTVVDSTGGNPIQYASVSVIRQRTGEIVTGGITDKKGSFYITEIPLGRYQVAVEFIGYKRVVKGPFMLSPRGNGTEQNLGKIELTQNTLRMETVEVQGERPLFVQNVEKKIFNVEQNTLSSGGSALDALRQVPGVDVDIDGNISLRGNSNVNVLIDGKPSTMTGSDREALLENIPSDNIRDIEVITNPSAKYDPDGMAGIINIILKENRLAGLNGNFNSGSSGNGAHNASGQINFRNEKLNLFANTGFRHDVRDGGGDNYRETALMDITSILDQEIDGERGGDNIFVKSGIDIYPDPDNSISMTISYSDGNRISDRVVYTDQTVDSLVQYYRTTDGDNDRKNIDLTLSYDRKFKDPKQKLSSYVHHSAGVSSRSEALLTTALPGYEELVDPDPEKTTTDNESRTTNIQVDYVHPFNNSIKLEAGYKGTLRSIENRFFTYDFDGTVDDYIVDDARSNHFRFNENIQAGYAQFSWQKGILGLQLGLRGETATIVSELEDTDEIFENPYTSLFPSAYVSVGPPKIFQIQVSYSRRINRPSYRRLNPSIYQLDRMNIRMGNPFLKPEYVNVVELNYSRFKRGLTLSLGTYYRRITDKINHYKYIRDDGVSVMTYENFNEQETYGAEFIFSGSMGKKLRLMVSGNVFADEVNASNVFEDYNRTSTGFTGRFTTTWKVAPSTEMMLMGFYRSPRDIPIGKIQSMFFTSLSLKKKFLDDRLAVSLRLNDLFDTMGFKFETYGDNYFQESSRKWDSQIASISLEYRFGKMEDRSRYNRQRDRNREENGSGLGGYEIE